MMVFDKIKGDYNQGIRQFAVLIDPDKSDENHLDKLLEEVNNNDVDFVLLGGSSVNFLVKVEKILYNIRKRTKKKVILFPGNVSHLIKGVDAVLFLSLISGRNPDYLIENHVKAASSLNDVEVIPVGYILIDGGRRSTTELVSGTQPMSVDDIPMIVNTAKAGELLGHKMIYLEAGSGAYCSVSSEIIKAVKKVLHIPLIVGGGLKSAKDVVRVYDAGADVVVVGNALEADPLLLQSIVVK